MLLGVDTGGTFTDFVLYTETTVRFHKVLSTPDAPERAILQGIREMGLDYKGLKIIHGTTVATNAVLERKGARTAYITNRGLKDVLIIGRQNRKELYNLSPVKRESLVPAELCLETGGRISADNRVIEPLTNEDISELLTTLDQLKPAAIAINFLFSYLNDQFEAMLADALPDKYFVTLSSRLLPEYREYERGMTNGLNAYGGPLVQGYMKKLQQQVSPAKFSVMQSSGNTCQPEQAGEEAVHLLLSGPAGGVCGARYIGLQTDHEKLLTFDMGGTSTDVAMIDKTIKLGSHGNIDGYPVAVPQVDIHTIGAGGGSIARVDAGGVLLVGPTSAGSVPGPACYGLGGTLPTVTDANLVLGHLPAQALLGGNLVMDQVKAEQAVAPLAGPLGVDTVEQAAAGIIKLANEHMAQALRVISIERGIDPREFVLVSFGGAGGLHVCALAEVLEIRRAISPARAGVLSALGMLVAPTGRQLVKTLVRPLLTFTEQELATDLQQLSEQGIQSITAAEAINREQIKISLSLDLCYQGQSFNLNIPWQGIARTEKLFHQQHQRLYGHRLDTPVELVNIRAGVTVPAKEISMPEISDQPEVEPGHVMVYGIEERVPVWQRVTLSFGQQINGPAILLDDVSTTWISPDWSGQIDRYGNLILDKVN